MGITAEALAFPVEEAMRPADWQAVYGGSYFNIKYKEVRECRVQFYCHPAQT